MKIKEAPETKLRIKKLLKIEEHRQVKRVTIKAWLISNSTKLEAMLTFHK